MPYICVHVCRVTEQDKAILASAKTSQTSETFALDIGEPYLVPMTEAQVAFFLNGLKGEAAAREEAWVMKLDFTHNAAGQVIAAPDVHTRATLRAHGEDRCREVKAEMALYRREKGYPVPRFAA